MVKKEKCDEDGEKLRFLGFLVDGKGNLRKGIHVLGCPKCHRAYFEDD